MGEPTENAAVGASGSDEPGMTHGEIGFARCYHLRPTSMATPSLPPKSDVFAKT
jgi:hypothetical protein